MSGTDWVILPSAPGVFVKKGSPAHDVLLRIADDSFRPGQAIPVTDEEMRSLSDDTKLVDDGVVQ